MARPNGPQSPPPGGRAPRPDPQNWAQGAAPAAARPAARPAQPQQPAPSYPAQSAGAAYQQAAFSSQQGQQPELRYTQPAPAAQPARAAKPASAFDTLLAQEDPHSYGAQLPYNGNSAYPQAAHAAPAAAPSPAYGRDATASRDYAQRANSQQPAAQSSGYDGWGNDAAGFGAQAHPSYTSQAHDAFANQRSAQSGYGQNAHYGAAPANSQFGPADDWGHGDPYGQRGHEPSLDEPFGDTHGYGQPEHTSGIEQSYAEDDEYEEEPRRRGRLPMIAAAAIGALLCGGGLAYGYKSFLGPGLDGKTPLIKSSADPSKVKPDDPGGRKFAHSDNKIMGGPLSDAGGETTGSVTGSTDGARKVPTMEVRPDGSMVPASSGGPGPDKPAMTASAMDFPAAGDTGAKAGAPPAPEKPTVVSKAEPTPPAAASAAPDTQSAVDDPPPAPAPKKVTAKKVAAAAAPVAPIGPQPTGAGWVAVLASAPVSASSQMDSLKQFADMQQKYGDVLGDKTPSVQEANLGEKGRYHRLVVGPPGSRDSANSICGSLKSQGYSGCWVMQY